MSIWSTLGKFVGAAGSVAGPIVSIANPLLGAGLTAGSATLGKLSTDYENKKSVENSNNINLSENQKNREFNALEAEKNRLFQSNESVKQNAFNAAQSQLAFDRSAKFQQEMWQKENEYNTPLAQIKRLEQAGVNPNLFGGDNTAGSAGSAVSPAASGSAPSGSAASVGGSLPVSPYSFVNPALESAQIRLANANAENAERNAERTKSLLPGELRVQGLTLNLGVIDARLKQSEIDSIKSKMKVDQSTIKQMDEQTNNLIKQGRLLELDEKQREIFLKQYEERLVTELMQMKSNLRLDEWNIKHIASQIALNASQADLNAMNTANAFDVHLMNGIELQYKGKMLKLAYDKESNDYALSLLEGKKETRLKEFRANDSNELYRFVNGALDDVEIITRMAGNIFGSMPDYIKKK